MDIDQRALELHEKARGKISIASKVPLKTREDLSLIYTPGVAAPCRAIAENPEDIYKYTGKGNTVAVITDGSSILSLGDIGPGAGLPVMEGKCILFKHFADIDAFPIGVKADSVDDFVDTVKRISSSFGGINLEDITAPKCFEIEERLSKELDIPVMHDDQHGTAIVALAALINALKVVEKSKEDIKVTMSGAGAAGSAIAKLLVQYGVKNVVMCDRHGAIGRSRPDLVEYKRHLAEYTNPNDEEGHLEDVIKGADVFIGVSQGGLVSKEMVESMAKDAIVFGLANPDPEIMPDEAKAGGVAIVGTGRSDFPNQINNALAFPGVFRGLLDSKARNVTQEMKLAAAEALAGVVKNPNPDRIVPDLFSSEVVETVAKAVADKTNEER